MFELKPLAVEAIPRALERAERYRLLNEPSAAESICLDILAVAPDHQPALVVLLLARTDQFETGGSSVEEAAAVLPHLRDEYERAYYAGLIRERRGKALLRHPAPGSGFAAYQWFREAMAWYERAEALRPPGNDDARLRWNTCARTLMRNPQLAPPPEERSELLLE